MTKGVGCKIFHHSFCSQLLAWRYLLLYTTFSWDQLFFTSYHVSGFILVNPDGLSLFYSFCHGPETCIGNGNGNPLQCSCLENPRDGGPWWAAVYGVAQSRTRLKWLSSSSSIDLEKYKLEQGTIWNWTDPALPATASEKFLDIFTIIILKHFYIFFYF